MKHALGIASLTMFGLAVSAAVSAADDLDGFVDMRLDYSIIAGNVTEHLAGQNTTVNYGQTDRGTLTWLGSLGLRNYGGWVWGLGASYDYQAVTLQSQKDTLQSWAALAEFGYAVPIGDHFELELVPYIGFGRAYLKTPSNTSYGDAASAYTEGGLNVNAVFIFSNGFEWGANAGLLLYETSIVNHDTGLSYRFQAHDPTIGLFIGMRM